MGTAEELAGRRMQIIEAAIARRDLDGLSLLTIVVQLNPAEESTVSLDDLPGHSAQRAWVGDLKRDVSLWKTGELLWADVDRGAITAGPRGTGRTLFARPFARTLSLKLVATSRSGSRRVPAI